ncbi:[Fe-Fe] hydrogenase large subunit C-terminal domain-containing protein [Carboxylicivirga linearis]|uniref:4Fe-4S binding protein n=1 Tax=Carboxylicivirga linearis TaxID=1628157 RepID=A0ABS5JR00_9BACT|nr:[Fe-Fe] hydrogenase large subunit C-terminal domain-containing protein [Carboxylicivirga linearis]MBS2097296.1 4Fe-4S binding protein [Carboxylicivirga linearis]
MNLQPIYTETNDCKDCYKCIRECPNKAIKVTDNKASIIDSMCVYCGRCVSVCPTQAKKVRDGISRARLLIKNKKEVYVSLAPSYIAEYGTNSEALISAIKKLGFKGVSETALGAQEVSKQVHQFLNIRQGGTYISSACPVVVELIRKHYPQHSLSITPFMSPMLTHAKQLRNLYGNDIGIVFIGPCIGKKSEADSAAQCIDVALTFKELNNWLEKEKISINDQLNCNSETFIPQKAQHGTIYPIDGGMIETINKKESDTKAEYMYFSGLKNIKNLLDNLDSEKNDDLVFLELLACETGCINGPGMSDQKISISKQLSLRNTCKQRSTEDIETVEIQGLNIERDFFNIPSFDKKSFSEKQIKEALHTIGKTEISDELNCSGCGYDSCRDFAKAMLQNHAEPEMCVSYMRHVAHHKATILLQKIPSGVIVLDDAYQVVEMNAGCARILGEDIQLCYDANPGMRGAHIDKIGSFGSLFKTALLTGKEYYEMPIIENGKQLQLSIFNVQKHKLVTGILQSVAQPEFQKDIIEKRTREVINKNMETVQKIALLLGENASYTDSLLNSILETQEKKDAE